MESFEVENFRSLKHLKLEKLARVNVLVGKNNVGKSSVLESLYALTRIEMPDWFESLETIRGVRDEDQDMKSLFFNFNFGNPIRVTAAYSDSITKFGFSLASLSEPAMRRRKGIKSLLLCIDNESDGTVYPFMMLKGGEYSETAYESMSSESEEFLDSGLPDKLAPRHNSEFLTTTIDLELLSDHLSFLTINKDEEKLLAIVKQVDPRVQSLSLDSKGRVHFDLGETFSQLASVNHMGEGIQRLLSVVAAIANVSGGTMLIDEIDNGLHYSALRILWKGILQAAREYDVQIFATTHSAEALRHLTRVLDEEENASYRDDIAAYTLIRADDDTVRSYRHDYEQLDYALDHGVEIRN